MNTAQSRLTCSAHGHHQPGSGLGVLIIERFRRCCCCLFWDHPWKDNAHFKLGVCVCVFLISSWMKPFSERLHSACQNHRRCHHSSISGLGWFWCFPLFFFFKKKKAVVTSQIRCLSPCQWCWKATEMCVCVCERARACKCVCPQQNEG